MDRIGAAFACGSIHGVVKSAYYSLNNGYFVNNLNQDTTVIGGYIKYETAPFMAYRQLWDMTYNAVWMIKMKMMKCQN